jgi:prepilin-type N-terminal cleavage/methylation domain-containing protein
MRARVRSQRGFTIIEMVAAMAIAMVVLGMTVTVFVSMWGQHRTITSNAEAQDEVRIASDRLARDLRNLASPTALRNIRENRPRAVEYAQPSDFVFRTVDEKSLPVGSLNTPNLMRVRYCLDASERTNEVLWMQTQRWTAATPPAMPAVTSCPAAGWGTQRRLATHITNMISASVTRPLFTYDSTNVEQVTRVTTDLYVDLTPGSRPAEARITSGVHLRNQNQFPEAAFNIVTLDAVNRLVRFDGSASRDAEAQALRYCWYIDPPVPLPDCGATPLPASYLGEGAVFSYKMPAGAHKVVLRVEDPAGLRDDHELTWP